MGAAKHCSRIPPLRLQSGIVRYIIFKLINLNLRLILFVIYLSNLVLKEHFLVNAKQF